MNCMLLYFAAFIEKNRPQPRLTFFIFVLQISNRLHKKNSVFDEDVIDYSQVQTPFQSYDDIHKRLSQYSTFLSDDSHEDDLTKCEYHSSGTTIK